MATNQDFDNLIVRIDTATDELEQAVALVEGGASNVTQASAVAQQAVVDAQQAVADATTQATNAQQSAVNSQQSAIAAQQALDAIENGELGGTGGIEEAPKDGKQYARKDGAWATIVVEGGVGVQSVNNIHPDSKGNVTIAIPTVPTKLSELDNDEGFITADDLPQESGVEEAPNDGNSYVRKNKGWVRETTGGGSSKPAYESSVTIGGSTYTVKVNRPILALPQKDLGALDILTTRSYEGINYGKWSDMIVDEIMFEWEVDNLPLPDGIIPMEAIDITTTATNEGGGWRVEEGYNVSTGNVSDGELARRDDTANLIGLGNGSRTPFALPVGSYFINFNNYDFTKTSLGPVAALQERNRDGAGVAFIYGIMTVEESKLPLMSIRDEDTPNKLITMEMYKTSTTGSVMGKWVYSPVQFTWIKVLSV